MDNSLNLYIYFVIIISFLTIPIDPYTQLPPFYFRHFNSRK